MASLVWFFLVSLHSRVSYGCRIIICPCLHLLLPYKWSETMIFLFWYSISFLLLNFCCMRYYFSSLCIIMKCTKGVSRKCCSKCEHFWILNSPFYLLTYCIKQFLEKRWLKILLVIYTLSIIFLYYFWKFCYEKPLQQNTLQYNIYSW